MYPGSLWDKRRDPVATQVQVEEELVSWQSEMLGDQEVYPGRPLYT